jgi:hypothetical protein
MKALRATALVMFTLAAIDFTIYAVKAVVNSLTGSNIQNLFPILLALGVLAIVLDLMMDKNTFVGRHTHNLLEKLLEKLRGMLAFIGATTFGTGVVKEESPKKEKSPSPAASNPNPPPPRAPISIEPKDATTDPESSRSPSAF